MQRYWSFVCLSFVFSLSSSEAAVPGGPLVVTPGKISGPLEKGTVVGGKARDELSLLGVRFEPSAGEVERLALVYGDRFGKPLKGEPGYFHVALDRNSQRVVLDLAQMQMTAVGPARLSRILTGSKLVASSEMTMDPLDGSTNITLQTKVPVHLKVVATEGEPATLAIELVPQKKGAK